jgi:hypothetical protein
MIHITGFGEAVAKAEGESVSYETVQRTPEEVIEYLQQQLHEARKDQARYRRVKRLARGQKLMIASKDGFTLVEDLDEYLTQLDSAPTGPLTRDTIIKEALNLMEQAFDDNYAMTKAAS